MQHLASDWSIVLSSVLVDKPGWWAHNLEILLIIAVMTAHFQCIFWMHVFNHIFCCCHSIKGNKPAEAMHYSDFTYSRSKSWLWRRTRRLEKDLDPMMDHLTSYLRLVDQKLSDKQNWPICVPWFWRDGLASKPGVPPLSLLSSHHSCFSPF